jgi:hypothetical protein
VTLMMFADAIAEQQSKPPTSKRLIVKENRFCMGIRGV